MANINQFGSLSLELLDIIICSLSKKDQASLSQTSRFFHLTLARYMYSSWEYHGSNHSFKSLHCLLRTSIQNPDIASLVKTLDVREWGDCPRVQDHLFDSEIGSDDASSDDYSDEPNDPDTMEEIDSEYGSIEVAIDSSVKDNESISSFASINNRPPDDGGITDEEYSRDFPIIRLAVRRIELQDANIFDYEMDIRERKEDVLIALLIANLPSLTTLYVVLPEEHEAVPNLVKRAIHTDSELLRNLQTVYLCSALRESAVVPLPLILQLTFNVDIGFKGHLEYDLDANMIIDFLNLPSIRSAYTLKATSRQWSLDNYDRRPMSNYLPEYNAINYALEQSDINPLSEIASLIRFKDLQTLRWSQYFSCVSKGSCAGPFYRTLQIALNPFKDTLANLDLDLRRRPCHLGMDAGHAFNPRADVRDMVAFYKEPHERENGRHLIGSMADFSKLKHLSIDAAALHGDSVWGYSDRKIADSLPESLESLLLQSTIQNYNADVLLVALSTTLSEDVTDLARRAHLKVPLLKSMAIKMLYTSSQKELSKAWSPELKSIQDAFAKARIEFQVSCEKLESSKGLVQIPFFKDINDGRYPGLN